MEILTPFQNEFLKAFAKSPLNGQFYLTGGTALSAFYLKHRFSEDLDFFTDDPTAIRNVPAALNQISSKLHCQLRVERSLPAFFDGDMIPRSGDPVKIDFAVDSPFRLKPLVINSKYGFRLDHLLDISCNKLSALFDRAEAKDFVDVYFILKEKYSWKSLLANAKKKHVGLEPHLIAQSFLRVQDLEFLPRMVKPLNLNNLKSFFLKLSRRLMDELK